MWNIRIHITINIIIVTFFSLTELKTIPVFLQNIYVILYQTPHHRVLTFFSPRFPYAIKNLSVEVLLSPLRVSLLVSHTLHSTLFQEHKPKEIICAIATTTTDANNNSKLYYLKNWRKKGEKRNEKNKKNWESRSVGKWR